MSTKRKPTEQVQIGLRLQERLRAKLEQAATKNYESLNREIVDRLERSFDRQDLLIEALTLAYGGKIAGRLILIGRAIQEAGRTAAAVVDSRNNPDQWVRDPFAYKQAADAAMMVLYEFRPKGEPAVPKATWLGADFKPELIGARIGKSLTDAVKGKAPPDLRKIAATARELLELDEESGE